MHHNQIAEKTVIKEKLTLEGKKDTFTYKDKYESKFLIKSHVSQKTVENKYLKVFFKKLSTEHSILVRVSFTNKSEIKSFSENHS